MEEASEHRDQVTQDNKELSSLMAEPEQNQGDTVENLTCSFKNVFKDLRSGYKHLNDTVLIHKHKHLNDQIT
jgi:hypothetical protein